MVHKRRQKVTYGTVSDGLEDADQQSGPKDTDANVQLEAGDEDGRLEGCGMHLGESDEEVRLGCRMESIKDSRSS